MPWPWVILGRIPRLAPVEALAEVFPDEQAEAEEDEESAELESVEGDKGSAAELESVEGDEAPDFSIPFAPPPRVTVMTVGPNPHPDPSNIDLYPYVLAVEPGYLLFNFGVAPFYGVCFDDRPFQSNLIVVRHFHLAGVDQGHPTTATAERIPARDIIPPQDGEFSVVTNIESIGLLRTIEGPDEFVIAELMVDEGSPRARVVHIRAGAEMWSQYDTANPLPDHQRQWVPSGVVSHDEKLWWFDLSWGLISYDPADGPAPLLLFHHLPEGRTLNRTLPGIRDHRCITESEGELRYVEIIPGGNAEEATVSLWTQILGYDDETLGWNLEVQVSFADIWDDDGYTNTGLPRKVPVLVAVSPSNADLVYFVLEQEERIFSIDLLMRTVFEFVDEDYDLVTPWPAPPSSRYVLPWPLPQEVAEALGLDPFDDSGGAGKLEAEIDAALEALLIEDEQELAEEIYDALEEELQEEEIHHDEHMAVEVIDAADEALAEAVVLPEAEIHNVAQPVAGVANEEVLDLNVGLGVQMDPETLSRLKAEVKEFARVMAMDQPGPSQDPGDDAPGEGAF